MDFSRPIDAVGLAALKRGCRRTRERVYRDYASAAWTLALRLTGCEAQAWDAVQAGFVHAFERVGQLREPGRFGFWLRRIVVNQVMDGHRRRFETLDKAAVDQSVPAAMTPEVFDLERALASLDATDRLVVWLHDAEGMTHGEIAELAGQSVSWSKSRLARARERLRRKLDAGLRPAPRQVKHG